MIWNNSTLYLQYDKKKIIDFSWDLSKYWIYFNCESKVISFIELIQNINDKNGYYFNVHYMINILVIKNSFFQGRFYKILLPYLELQKKTKVLIATRVSIELFLTIVTLLSNKMTRDYINLKIILRYQN